jgi:hypothetical protein
MVYFVLALWLFRGRNCGYGQVMAKLADGLSASSGARTCWPGNWRREWMPGAAGGGGGGGCRTSPRCRGAGRSWALIRCGCCPGTWRGRQGRTARRGCPAAGCASSRWTGPPRTCRTARRTPRSSGGPRTSPGTARPAGPVGRGGRVRDRQPAGRGDRPLCRRRAAAGSGPAVLLRPPACWCSRTGSSCPGPWPAPSSHRRAHPVARLGVVHPQAGKGPRRRHLPGGTEATPQERWPRDHRPRHRVHRAHHGRRRGRGVIRGIQPGHQPSTSRSTRRWTRPAATRAGGAPRPSSATTRPTRRRTARPAFRRPRGRPTGDAGAVRGLPGHLHAHRDRRERGGHPPDRISFPHALAAATDTVAAFPLTRQISPSPRSC